MPRAISPKERIRGCGVNFLPSTWEALRRLAFEQRTTISEQVRRAVADYLEKRNEKKAKR